MHEHLKNELTEDEKYHNLKFYFSVKQDGGSSKRKSGKRKKDEADNEEVYEQLPRKLFAADSNKNMKMVLPIKTKAGIIPRMVEDDESNIFSQEKTTIFLGVWNTETYGLHKLHAIPFLY